jgi:hypothetical protein
MPVVKLACSLLVCILTGPAEIDYYWLAKDAYWFSIWFRPKRNRLESQAVRPAAGRERPGLEPVLVAKTHAFVATQCREPAHHFFASTSSSGWPSTLGMVRPRRVAMVGATERLEISPSLTPGLMPAPQATKIACKCGRAGLWP